MMKRAYLSVVSLSIATFAWAQSPAGAAKPEPDDAKFERALKISQVVKATGARPGAKIADIGAGDGIYEHALSVAVGAEGHVFAEDISENQIKRLRDRLGKNPLENV